MSSLNSIGNNSVKRAIFAATTFCFLLAPAPAQGQTSKEPQAKPQKQNPLPDILVIRDGWQADPATVKKVLNSTARELWKNFPDRKLPPMIVYPKKGPITLYQRGPNDEIFIRLNTGKTFWAQYAFQFSHELCHVLCEYDADPHGNNWFEESICELASLYTLRQMGETWKENPPFDHWKSYSKHLASYAQQRMERSELGKDETLADWLRKNIQTLYANATRRDLNLVVATKLLPMFEENPEYWQAIEYLNKAKPKQRQSFQRYLSDWRDSCPDEQKGVVDKIAAEFRITLESK